MTKMKAIIQILMILCIAEMVSAVMTCSVKSGTCAVVKEMFYNQTHQGQTIQNVSVNVTINGTGASPTGWCNVACLVGKSYGNYTNQTNSSVIHNITYCNVETRMTEGFTSVYILNQTASATLCNVTIAIKLNQTYNVTVWATPYRERVTTNPIVYIGIASALGGVTLAYLWNRHRRS